MVAASTWRPQQPSSEGTNATEQTTREMVRKPFCLLLQAGDVETNPGPRCYACGQKFRQSDTPLACHTPECEIKTQKQTRCSGVPRSQQSLSGSPIAIQICMTLAHGAKRCSGPTAPPDQWRCFHYRNITETVAGVSASLLTLR